MTSFRPRLGSVHRGVAAIAAGASGGQLLTLIAAPFLSRVYSPNAFGTYAVLLSVAMIASTVASLRLETAIPLASPSDARTLVKIAIAASLAVAACCIPITLGMTTYSDTHLTILELSALPYLVCIMAIYAILTGHTLRDRKYSAVARRNFLQQAGTSGGQLLAARWSTTGLGLTLGLAFGRSVGVGSLLRQSRLEFRTSVEAAPYLPTLKRYWRFPAIFMPSAILNVAGLQIPIFLLASRYGTEAAGNLSQAIKFGAIPAVLLGGAVSSVVMAEIAKSVRTGERNQRKRYLRVSKALAPVAICWFLALVLLAPPVLPLILGPEWTSAGTFAAAIGVSVATGLIASPLSIVLILYERPFLNMSLDAVRVCITLALGLGAWGLGMGSVAAVLSMSLGMAATYAATWVVGLRIVSQPPISLSENVAGLEHG